MKILQWQWAVAAIAITCLALASSVQTVRAFTLWNGSPHPKWNAYVGFYYFDSSFTHQGIGWQNAWDGAATEWQTNAWLGWEPMNCSDSVSGQTCWPIRSVDNGTINPLATTTMGTDSFHHFNSWVGTVNSYSGINWYTGTGTVPINYQDFATMAKHELGHAVGECHTATSGRLMYPSYPPGTRLYVGSDAVNGNYYLYENGYSGPGPESSSSTCTTDSSGF